MTTRLTDYGRFARATILTIVSLALLLSGLLAVAGRGSAVSGVAVGAIVAVADVWLLLRSLRRVDVAQGEVRAGALTGLLMGRFVMVGLLIGIALIAQGLDKVGVIAGFLLFPVAAVLVALVSLRIEGLQRRHPGAAAR
ncbi:MAG TPA: hypothetical protein VGQ42_09400 [Candidatus Dormibacteraeota bacterium]|jgi:hypothetical protein|nr:hypothetical protein [Candidatus Dormibacteraeota bacterium]